MLIGLFTGQLAYLLRQRVDQLAATYARTLRSFAALVSLRDEQTAGHCERVAENACAVGRTLRLKSAELTALYWAGLLHDLGKVAVPDSVLLKPGPLTNEEYQVVKTHCILGSDLLVNASQEFDLVATGVRSHHERWDGSGYPDSLAGTDIPLFGRILAIADVFEAVTSERPYHRAISAEEGLGLLERQAGKQFDPDLIAAFIGLYRQGAIRLAEPDLRKTRSERLASFDPAHPGQEQLPLH